MIWISLPLMTSDQQLMTMNWKKINTLTLEMTGDWLINGRHPFSGKPSQCLARERRDETPPRGSWRETR